jgi:hypothetical protein
MPIASYADAQTGLFIDVYEGDVSFSEWRDHIAAVIDDTAWQGTTKSLTDLSRGRLPTLDEDERQSMHALFVTRAVHVAGRRMAVIDPSFRTATKSVEQLAITKMAARAIVFASAITASIWLGVDHQSVTSLIDRVRTAIGSAAEN